MDTGYNQFCPVAKASEILAARWTPLILRDLMAGAHSFNDIHRGIPLISRAVLAARLRELEKRGIVCRTPRAHGSGWNYCLTSAGHAFGPVITELRRWGLAHAHDRVGPGDLDPALLLWGLRRRANRSKLPSRRIVVRFEFSGVPASRTKYRIMWLLLDQLGGDVCVKDPGYPSDAVFRGNIADFVSIYLGQVLWKEMAGKSLNVEGDRFLIQKLPGWLQLDKVPRADIQAVGR